MTTPKTNRATDRLQHEYLLLKNGPVPYVVAEPIPGNILKWHYVFTGPENTPYARGLYHGKLVFPINYPFESPSIYMITPNGRFKTDTPLCLSDAWTPVLSVPTILTGFLSIMIERTPTLGSIESSEYEKRQLAGQSLEFNLRDNVFCDLFPDMVTSIKIELERRAEEERDARSNPQSVTSDELERQAEVERDARSNPQSVTSDELERQAEVERAAQSNPQSVTSNDIEALLRNQFGHNDQSPVYSTITKLCVVIGFAVFSFMVHYVLRVIFTE
ncbi:Ubiquitin-conjugating enzyme E2 J2 [Zootermopsis nevadensis]|uniref:Ubiquitin-conjugating enzyme E2 J2 n=1 Tax=Zootermopsis nevadensis TaxID=136037 RepID=A0A067QJZ3_ZOONE|nr:Ubiquitin-conjugating enzyme E2 J2 [Zootermopsis nevadensis]